MNYRALTFPLFSLISVCVGVSSEIVADDRQGCSVASEMIQKGMDSKEDLSVREKIFRDALVKCPKMSEGHAGLANILKGLAKFEESIKEYSAAIDLNDRIEYRLGLASVFLASGNFENADRELDLVLSKESTNLQARQFKAIVAEKKGDIAGAITELEKAIETNTQDALSHYNLGVLFSKNGDRRRAATSFAEACNLDGKDSESCLNAGSTFVSVGDLDQGVVFLERAINRDNKNDKAITALAVVFEKLGELDKAELNLKRALSVTSDSVDVSRSVDIKVRLASILIRKGQESLAVESLAPLSLQVSGNPSIWATLGLAYLGLGDYSKAESALKEVIKLDPTDAESRNNLGVALRNLDKESEAKESFAAALSINPELEEAKKNLAELEE